ncbi:MAG: hypothetical protein IKU37_01320 [Candidatus Gastranaerophilales bacterium]|nr:hypothetical protein [Candidatus Gastranaerophilales bacterium]
MATLTTSYQKIGEKAIASTGYGTLYARIYAKYNSYSSGAGTVNVTTLFQLYLSGGSAHSNGCTASIDGASWSGNISISAGEGNVKNLVTKTYNVSTNSDGSSKGYKSNASYNIYGASGSFSASFNTPKVPRYANIKSFTVSKRDETSVTVSWGADARCDAVWYSTNNGSSWVGTGGSTFVISGLSAGTSYNFRIKVRRADSQLTTTSGTYTQSTYDYPYCTSSPNFIIGQPLTLNLYNPLGRNVNVLGIGKDNTQIFSGSTTGTSLVGFNDSESVDAQYNSIPNDASSTYQVKVIYNNITKTRNEGNTYYVDVNNAKPVFEDFNYSTNYYELTGNTNTVIDGLTTITFSIPVAKKAIAQNGASITKYVFSCDIEQVQSAYSSSSAVSNKIYNCKSNIIKVTAIDSRGLETSIVKTIPNFKSYHQPAFVSENADRKNGVEEIVYLDTKLNFWNKSFGSERNRIISLKYRVKETGSSNWSNWFSANEGELVIVNEEATLENYRIYLNGISTGFSIGTQYDLQLQVTDGVNNIALNTIESDIFSLTDGIVAFSVLKDNSGEYHLGIGGMPNSNYDLFVNGKMNVFPIGAIYLSINNTNPSTYFGGTWELISQGRTLVGVDENDTDFNASQKTGGEKEHTLTIDEMPEHNHGERGYYSTNTGVTTGNHGHVRSRNPISSDPLDSSMENVGGGQPHNNMPPYFTCYIWCRTA